MPFISIRKDEVVDPNALAKDGSNSPTTDIDWGGFKITNLNVAAPTADGDASNKKYVDDEIAGITSVTVGGSLQIPASNGAGDFTYDTQFRFNFPDNDLFITDNFILAGSQNALQANTRTAAAGGIGLGTGKMLHYFKEVAGSIQGLYIKDGRSSTDRYAVTNVQEADNAADGVAALDVTISAQNKINAGSTGDGGNLVLAPGTSFAGAKGAIDASTSKIQNVVDPTADQEAATKKYVDDNETAAAGATNQVQYNDGASGFAASANFLWDSGNNRLHLTGGAGIGQLKMIGGTGRAANSVIGIISGDWGSGKNFASMRISTGDDAVNKDDQSMQFRTAEGNVEITSLTLKQNGIAAFAKQVYSEQDTETQAASAAHTIDWNDGNATEWDLQAATGNVTLALSNPNAGASYIIKIIQSSTARTVTWPVTVKWPGGTAPTISVANDAIDVISLYYDGANYLANFNQAYA